jgi:hypothetical protein
METVVFKLFGDAGFVNPTPWPSGIGPSVWDDSTGVWRAKQTRDFDGGWRWFDKHGDNDALMIYNVKLHKMAYYILTHEEIVDTCIGPEFILLCAKSHVLCDHNFFTARDWVIDRIRADFLKLRREIFGDRIRAY